MALLISSLLIAVLVQTIFFVFAYKFKTDKFTDLSYGLTFVLLAIFLLNNSSHFNYQVLTFLMILFWGIRIAGFLFLRVLILKKDKRFDGIRENVGKFAKFWLLQGLSVWIIMIPSIIIFSEKEYGTFGYSGLFGFMTWLVGLSIETIADLQKFVFKTKNKVGWVNVGLWKYAKHPNYFGEMLVWWGIWILGIPHFSGIGFLTIIGPIYITVLLLKISGVPILDKKYRKVYKDNAEYKKYYDSTNLLVPVPKQYFKDSNAKF